MDDQRKEKTYRLSQIEAAVRALMTGSISTARLRSEKKIAEALKQEKPQGNEEEEKEIKKLHYRIRRMMELDRQHGLMVGEEKLEQYPMAFLDDAKWGKGHPTRFTAYRACNIAIACDLQRLGFNQLAIVDAMRLAAHSLKDAFDGSIAALTTSRRANFYEMQEGEKREDLHYFLLIDAIEAPKGTGKATGGRVADDERIAEIEVVRGEEALLRRLRERYEDRVQAICVIEMTRLAAKMVELLSIQPEKTAGRPLGSRK